MICILDGRCSSGCTAAPTFATNPRSNSMRKRPPAASSLPIFAPTRELLLHSCFERRFEPLTAKIAAGGEDFARIAIDQIHAWNRTDGPSIRNLGPGINLPPEHLAVVDEFDERLIRAPVERNAQHVEAVVVILVVGL